MCLKVHEVIKLMVWTDIKVTNCPGDCEHLLKLFIDKIKNLTQIIMMMILPFSWIVCHLPPKQSWSCLMTSKLLWTPIHTRCWAWQAGVEDLTLVQCNFFFLLHLLMVNLQTCIISAYSSSLPPCLLYCLICHGSNPSLLNVGLK